eukprot:jgi/Chlat1/4266/Chrsp29S04370
MVMNGRAAGRRAAVAWVLAWLLLLEHGAHRNCWQAAAQLSSVAHDDAVNASDNKFLQRKATDSEADTPDEVPPFGDTTCPVNAQLRWAAEASSSIYATPVIADLTSEGQKDVIVPTFVHYIDVMDGSDGAKLAGWPAFHKSHAHASPLLYDYDGDGTLDVLLATYAGEILVYSETGIQFSHKLEVPRLQVRKDWYVGLNKDHVDHSHPDVGAPLIDQILHASEKDKLLTDKPAVDKPVAKETVADKPMANETSAHKPSADTPSTVAIGNTIDRDTESEATKQVANNDTGIEAPAESPQVVSASLESNTTVTSEVVSNGTVAEEVNATAAVGSARRRLMADEDMVDANVEEQLDDEKWETMNDDADRLWHADDNFLESMEDADEDVEQYTDPQYGNGDEKFEELWEDEPWNSQTHDEVYNFDNGYDEHDHYVDWEKYWGDEEFQEDSHQAPDNYVSVDAHILCTPVIANIDGDDVDELVVAVSYFYDREYYSEKEHSSELPADIDKTKYVAGGVVVFDMVRKSIKWSIHLDLTTDQTRFRAYIYSAPTVADLDGDGLYEIIVGTSVGFIYVLNSDGKPRENFPIQMGEIQGQVAVADINDDGYLEIVACDILGNVAAFNWRGQEIWERHVGSLIAQGATFGDVNGDGEVEVVFGTSSGHIYVLRGKDGTTVAPFPYKTHGRVMAQVLIVKLLNDRPQSHLVVPSFDGYVYLVDGAEACADTLDVGETAYSMVLADDVDNNGYLDLIVTTMNGNVLCFETPAKYHPLKAWPAQVPAGHGFAVRYGREGIFALKGSRNHRDIAGETMTVQFEIVDKRPSVVKTIYSTKADGIYSVTISVLGGRWHSERTHYVYKTPGVYTVKLECPKHRAYATIMLEMEDEHRTVFTDSFTVSFHMHFYRALKWLLILPFAAMAAALIFTQAQSAERLPSFDFGRNR